MILGVFNQKSRKVFLESAHQEIFKVEGPSLILKGRRVEFKTVIGFQIWEDLTEKMWKQGVSFLMTTPV